MGAGVELEGIDWQTTNIKIYKNLNENIELTVGDNALGRGVDRMSWRKRAVLAALRPICFPGVLINSG